MRRQGFSKYYKTAFVLSLGISLYPFIIVDELQSAEEAAKPSHEAVPAPAHSTVASKKQMIHTEPQKEDPSSYLVSAVAVKDLQKQREDLSNIQKELSAKEIEIQQREKSVAEELKKLEVVRAEMEKGNDQKVKENSQKVNRLVETILTMSPKSSAKLLGSVNEELAVAVMNQMDTARLGKILNIMDAETASRLSELMTGVVRPKKMPPTAQVITHLASQAPSQSEKGGDPSHANSERSNDHQSTDSRSK